MLPLVLAPILTKLAENGLTILSNAIQAKGKEFVEDQLGVDISTAAQTEAGIIRLKELEIQHEQMLLDAAAQEATNDLARQKLDNENTANAREANVRIQESPNASKVAKNWPYVLDAIIVLATITMIGFLVYHEVPVTNKEHFYMAFGTLLTLATTVVNYHRGSSSGSARKDETIHSIKRSEP
jgi:hypothetical protein